MEINNKVEESREVYYRYNDYLVSNGYDYEMEHSCGSHAEIYCTKYYVIKHTPKGVWVSNYYSEEFSMAGKHFILLSAHKKFACPTKKEALESFVARKQRQISILTARIECAKQALRLGEVEISKGNVN